MYRGSDDGGPLRALRTAAQEALKSEDLEAAEGAYRQIARQSTGEHAQLWDCVARALASTVRDRPEEALITLRYEPLLDTMGDGIWVEHALCKRFESAGEPLIAASCARASGDERRRLAELAGVNWYNVDQQVAKRLAELLQQGGDEDAAAMARRSRALSDAYQRQEAAALARRAIAADESCTLAHLALAEAVRHHDDDAQTIAALEAGNAAVGGSEALLVKGANIIEHSGGEDDLAIQWWWRAVRVNPGEDGPMGQLLVWLVVLGREPEAEELLEWVMTQHPPDSRQHQSCARKLDKLRRGERSPESQRTIAFLRQLRLERRRPVLAFLVKHKLVLPAVLLALLVALLWWWAQ